MTYQTILTVKGTTTIPVEIRKSLGLKPGMYVSFEQNHDTGEIILKKSLSIEDVRKINQQEIKKRGAHIAAAPSTDEGFTAYILDKYKTK